MATNQIVTHDPQTGEIMERTPIISEPSLAVSMARAEIDQQIATAHAYPRSIDRAMKNILTLSTLDEETAEECIYALPRGGKPIKGPSARLSEIIASQWGNCRVSARVTHVDRTEKYVEAEGIFHDLETNTAWSAKVRRRISDKSGRLLSEDMIVVTGNAACSIAKRNAVLTGVPKGVWRRAYERAEKVIAGTVETLALTKDKTMKAFAAFGVTPERVCAAIGVGGINDINLEHIPTLRGMYAALKNGEATVEEMFADAKPVSKAAVALDIPDAKAKEDPKADAMNKDSVQKNDKKDQKVSGTGARGQKSGTKRATTPNGNAPVPEAKGEQKEVPKPEEESDMLVDLEGWLRNVEDNIAVCESMEELKEVEEIAEGDYPRVPKAYSDKAKDLFENARGD